VVSSTVGLSPFESPPVFGLYKLSPVLGDSSEFISVSANASDNTSVLERGATPVSRSLVTVSVAVVPEVVIEGDTD